MWVWESDNAKGVFVIVHGASEHHGRYKWIREKLVDDGFHVVMGDLPGQGERPQYQGHVDSFDEYLDEIEKWWTKAKEYNLPIFLLGHSMGGLAVIVTMLKRNLAVEAVILSSPCLGLVNEPSKFTKLSGKVINKLTPRFRLPTNLDQVTRCETMLKQDEEDPLLVKKVSVRWYLELTKAIEEAHQQVKKFPEVPVLVHQGGTDLIVDKSQVRNWFNKLQVNDKYYKEWPELYHEVFNEPEKETVYHITKTFVEGHLS